MPGGGDRQELPRRSAGPADRAVDGVILRGRVGVGLVILGAAEVGVGAPLAVGDRPERGLARERLAGDDRWLAAEQPLPRELEQRVRAAVHELGLADWQRAYRAARLLPAAGGEDLNRRIGELEPRLLARHVRVAGRGRDLRAERRDLPEAGQRQRLVDRLRLHVPADPRVVVVAHQDVADTGPGQIGREARHLLPRLDRLLGRLQQDLGAGSVRHEAALDPGRARQRLERIVDRVAPGELPVRVGRDHQSGLPRGVPGEVAGRLVPVARHGRERAGLQALPGQLRERQTRQRERYHWGGGRAEGELAGPADPQMQPPCALEQVRAAERDRDREYRLELVGAAQRRQGPVEQAVDAAVQRAGERAVVARQADRGDDARAQAQPAALGHVPAREARQPGSRDHGRREDRGGGGDDRPPGRVKSGTAEIEVRRPGAGAAQHRGRGHGPRRRRRLLDVGQEVERVLALQQQRDHPPGGGREDREAPFHQQADPLPGLEMAEDIERRQEQDGERRYRIHPGHRHDRNTGTSGRAAGRRLAARGRDKRQHRPWRDHAGQGRRRRGAKRDRERGPQSEHDPRQQPGAVAADLQGAGQLDQAEEADADQQGEPQALDQPDGNVQQLAHQEERRHRNRIADVLIGEAAEPFLGIPERPQAGQEFLRINVDAELGVKDDAAGVGCAEDRQRDHEDDQEPRPVRERAEARAGRRRAEPAGRQAHPASAGRLRQLHPAAGRRGPAGREPGYPAALPGTPLAARMTASIGHVFRRMIRRRFQVASSRSQGIHRTTLHHLG